MTFSCVSNVGDPIFFLWDVCQLCGDVWGFFFCCRLHPCLLDVFVVVRGRSIVVCVRMYVIVLLREITDFWHDEGSCVRLRLSPFMFDCWHGYRARSHCYSLYFFFCALAFFCRNEAERISTNVFSVQFSLHFGCSISSCGFFFEYFLFATLVD